MFQTSVSLFQLETFDYIKESNRRQLSVHLFVESKKKQNKTKHLAFRLPSPLPLPFLPLSSLPCSLPHPLTFSSFLSPLLSSSHAPLLSLSLPLSIFPFSVPPSSQLSSTLPSSPGPVLPSFFLSKHQYLARIWKQNALSFTVSKRACKWKIKRHHIKVYPSRTLYERHEHKNKCS